MDLLIIFKSLLSRLLFFGHGILVVLMFSKEKGNDLYLVLVTPLLFLLIETCITIIYYKGVEYKYVWPAGFFYISCIIPVIWLYRLNTTQAASDDLVRLSEIGVILCIIIVRWLMPRGELTKDQLSALLLVYVGNAADILELFDTLEEDSIAGNNDVVIAVMVAFTWSMYQFTLNTTATVKGESDEDPKENSQKIRKLQVKPNNVHTTRDLKRDGSLQKTYIEDIRSQTGRILLQSYKMRGRGRKNQVAPIKNEEEINKEKDEIKKRELHGELYQILVTLLMQDGPFLILRLYLFIELNVSSEMHIFFTCKNAIVSILLVYRLLILSCSGKDEEIELNREDAAAKLRNIQLAMELNNARYNSLQSLEKS